MVGDGVGVKKTMKFTDLTNIIDSCLLSRAGVSMKEQLQKTFQLHSGINLGIGCHIKEADHLKH